MLCQQNQPTTAFFREELHTTKVRHPNPKL